MNIVFCISDCSRAGGMDRTLSIQANYWAENGHEVHIVTTENPQNENPVFTFSDNNLHIFIAMYSHSSSIVSNSYTLCSYFLY